MLLGGHIINITDFPRAFAWHGGHGTVRPNRRPRNDPRPTPSCSKADLGGGVAAVAPARPMMRMREIRSGEAAAPNRVSLRSRRGREPSAFNDPKDYPLNRSLSVLLPVHNAQATLESDVGRMLDLLPDLTHQFDVLIIDDGSTDATCEVADELATQYPQVKLLHRPRRRGVEAALSDGLARTESHVVLAHDGQPRIDTAEIVRLWHREAQFDRQMPEISAATSKQGATSSFHLLRRDAGQPAEPFRSVRRIEPQHAGSPAAAQSPSSSRRPNFLRRLRDFALGE
jgi:Glycosyl transferase family 2